MSRDVNCCSFGGKPPRDCRTDPVSGSCHERDPPHKPL